MAKKKYEVIRPWTGVEAGDVIELDEVHPAIKANVRLVNPKAKSGEQDDGSSLIEAAKVKAKEIEEEATQKAEGIIAKANADAEAILEAAKNAPPPPPAKK